jgi:hypothetical protein
MPSTGLGPVFFHGFSPFQHTWLMLYLSWRALCGGVLGEVVQFVNKEVDDFYRQRVVASSNVVRHG